MARRAVLTALALVWGCFIAQGVFYASVMPLWEGFDEFSHYAFLEDIALHGQLANPEHAFISRDVAESLRAAPVPWIIRTWQPDWISYEQFWRLSEPARAERIARLRGLPPSYANETDPANIRNYEAQQPPLAYLILSAPYGLMRHADLPAKVWGLRLVCVLIASAVVPFTFASIREVLGNQWVAIAGAALAASFPELYFDTARIGNEALAVALGSVLIWMLIQTWRDRNASAARWAMIGFLLACALLTKAYFLPVAAVAICAAAAQTGSRDLRARRAAACAGIAFAVAGWWYIRAWRLTGSITGEQAASSALKSGAIIHSALHVSWQRIADFAFISHIWLGGWSFLVVRTWMYRAIEILFALAAIGLAIQLARASSGVRIAIAIEAAFCAALALQGLALAMGGGAGVFGYYAFAVLAAEIVCLIAGWAGLGRAACRYALFAATAMFSVIGIFGLFIYAMPYWGGITAHDPAGNLHAIAANALPRAFPLEMRRLAWGKPLPAMFGLASLFVLAILLNCAVCWRALSGVRLEALLTSRRSSRSGPRHPDDESAKR